MFAVSVTSVNDVIIHEELVLTVISTGVLSATEAILSLFLLDILST